MVGVLYVVAKPLRRRGKSRPLPPLLKSVTNMPRRPRKLKLGRLDNLSDIMEGLRRTLRAMADGSLDSQDGARICNGLSIMRGCFELQQRLANPGINEPPRVRRIIHEFVHVSEPRPIDLENLEDERKQISSLEALGRGRR